MQRMIQADSQPVTVNSLMTEWIRDSIIAAQLRHADGGALAQRGYIHQLPQTVGW